MARSQPERHDRDPGARRRLRGCGRGSATGDARDVEIDVETTPPGNARRKRVANPVAPCPRPTAHTARHRHTTLRAAPTGRCSGHAHPMDTLTEPVRLVGTSSPPTAPRQLRRPRTSHARAQATRRPQLPLDAYSFALEIWPLLGPATCAACRSVSCDV